MSRRKRSEKTVMMPIPEGAVPEVYKLVAAYMASTTLPERVAVANNGEWTELEVRALCGKLRNAAAKAAFRRIAEEMGGWVTYGQMATAAGIDVDQLRPHLAWFSKYAKQIKGENFWPLEHEADPTQEKGEHARYRMPSRIARWWLAADGGDDFEPDGGDEAEDDDAEDAD